MQNKLANNVVFLGKETENPNACSIGFYYMTGSRKEKFGQYGITHFTEHMLFKGTSTRTSRNIAESFDRMGGYCNAFTEMEDVCAYCTFPASLDNLFLALDIMCDMSCNAVFDPEELEKERLVVQNEIIMSRDESEDMGLETLARSIWPDSGLGRSIAGSIGDVDSITREQIYSWYLDNFVHGELVVVVCGPKSVLSGGNIGVIRQKLETLPSHSVPLDYPFNMHYRNETDFVPGFYNIKSDFLQSQVYFAFPYSAPLSEADFYKATLFNTIMGDSMSSRLFDSLREKLGLCYSVYSFFSIYEDTCMWYAYGGCNRENTTATFNALKNQVLDFFERELTDQEIQIAKEHLCGEEKLNSSDPEFIMKNIQRNYSLGYDFYEPEKTIRAIRDVQKNDIMDFARKVLQRENCACLVYGKGLKNKRNIMRNYNV